MGKLQGNEKHVVMLECKGPVSAEDAAQFNKALHEVLKKFKSKIVFDLTGPKGN
jgi:argininosuccinate lyase